MTVYLYAVAEAHARAPAGHGLHRQPLRLIHSPELSALVSDQPRSTSEVGEDELWQHESAVEALMATHDVLPARFGTVLASDAAVRELLAERGPELSAALRRVAGANELAVRAVWLDRAVPRPRSGAHYMQAQMDAQRRAQALACTLDARLSVFSRATRTRALAQGAMAVSAAYLVDRGQIQRFRSEVEDLARQTAEAAIACTGPWPPYSFIEDGGGAR